MVGNTGRGHKITYVPLKLMFLANGTRVDRPERAFNGGLSLPAMVSLVTLPHCYVTTCHYFFVK